MSIKLIIIVIAILFVMYSCCKDKMSTTKEIKEKAVIADLSEADREKLKNINKQIADLEKQKEKIIGKTPKEKGFGESVMTKANKIGHLL